MPDSENENNIRQSTRPRTGSSLFRLKTKLILIIIGVLGLITIIGVYFYLYKPKLYKWKQNGITVAGGNGRGQKLHRLNRPEGIFIDKNKNIFVADYENHRIVKWKHNAKEGKIIAGGNKKGRRIDQLYGPTDVIVDEQ
ncbi:unnamed protein product, partial [Adineta steineri]